MGNPSGLDWILQWETLGLLGEEGNLGQDGVMKKGGFEGRQGPRRWIWEQCGGRD